MKSLLIAISTLTALPLSPDQWTDKDLKQSVAFYPLVGLLVGGLLVLACKIPLAHDLKSLLLLLLWVAITAAFHLDGLSDCLDGFFGGKTPEERQRIMKDPHIGAFGVTGIALALVFKYVLLTHLLSDGEAWKQLLFIPIASRWAVTLASVLFKAPPGNRGLGSQVLGLPAPWFAASTVVTLAMGIGLWEIQGVESVLLAAAVALAVGFLSQSRIGGLTGDGMGAIVELSEVSLLFMACLAPTKALFALQQSLF
ncbi:MAG TPA: adenosylcobinamide-GDP ribazoletransferase [bacterium]|jgi:adenosylcobinamide-GDP ribazoletransferase|nr:adenosylcobinamide-GDP ribazoletransferase [bacterium]